MVIYLYRWKIKSGKEKQFEENWAIVTEAILKECCWVSLDSSIDR